MTKLEQLLRGKRHITDCPLPQCKQLSRLDQLRLRARGVVREVMEEDEYPKPGNVFYLDDYRGKIK